MAHTLTMADIGMSAVEIANHGLSPEAKAKIAAAEAVKAEAAKQQAEVQANIAELVPGIVDESTDVSVN